MIAARDLQALSQDAIIALYALDLNPIGVAQVLRFCNFMQTNGNVSLGGVAYSAIPVEAEGFEYNGRGQLPTPRIRVSNVLGLFTPLLLQYQDLVGAKLTRIRTFAKHLDGGSNPNASATTEPDIYFVERKASESRLEVTWELRSSLDLSNVQLPGRRIMANLCGWQYRSASCGFTGGAVADIYDRPTNNIAKDECGRRLTSCELRFGVNQPLPYGGFPGVDNQRFN